MDRSPRRLEPASTEPYEEFLECFSRERERIFAYVYALLPHMADAEDVFQQCSVILWRKFSTFDRAGSFLAWACGVAYLEVRNFLRVSGRNRLQFDDELVQQLATDRLASLPQQDARLLALQGCLRKLTAEQRELLDVVYGAEQTVRQFAGATGRALQTLYNQLARLRRQLLDCVQHQLAADQETA